MAWVTRDTLIVTPQERALLDQLGGPRQISMPASWRGGFQLYAPMSGFNIVVSLDFTPPAPAEPWRRRLDRRLRAVPIVVWATLAAAHLLCLIARGMLP